MLIPQHSVAVHVLCYPACMEHDKFTRSVDRLTLEQFRKRQSF
ncbi:MAG: hypothetical protein R3B58_03465 [Phycisphaerales bacterium]